jgi:predicted DNA binding CopG/RHH family protein
MFARDMNQKGRKEGSMKTNKKKTPKFKNEDEERAFWSKESPLDYLDRKGAKKVTLSNLEPSTEVISLRLPTGLLSKIKLVASKNDIPYQSFMKMMLAEKNKRELEHAGENRPPI